jgi:hypothetical protein
VEIGRRRKNLHRVERRLFRDLLHLCRSLKVDNLRRRGIIVLLWLNGRRRRRRGGRDRLDRRRRWGNRRRSLATTTAHLSMKEPDKRVIPTRDLIKRRLWYRDRITVAIETLLGRRRLGIRER